METLCKIQQNKNYLLTLKNHFIFLHSFTSYLYVFCKKSESLDSIKLPFSLLFVDFYHEENYDFIFCLLSDKQIFCIKTDCLSKSRSLQKHGTQKLSSEVEAQCFSVQNSSKLLYSSSLNKIIIYNITPNQNDFPSLKIFKIILLDKSIPNHISCEDLHSNFKINTVISSSIRLLHDNNDSICESLKTNASSNQIIIPQRLFNILFTQQSNREVSIVCSPIGKVFWCCGTEVNVLIKMSCGIIGVFVLEVDFEQHHKSSEKNKLKNLSNVESENSTKIKETTEPPPLKRRKLYKDLSLSCLLVVDSHGEIAVFTSMNKKVFYIQIPSEISCCDLIQGHLIYSTSNGVYQVDIANCIAAHVARYIDECVLRKRCNHSLKNSFESVVINPSMISNIIIKNFVVDNSSTLEDHLHAYGMTLDGRLVKTLLTMKHISTFFTNKTNNDDINFEGRAGYALLPLDTQNMLESLEQLHVKALRSRNVADAAKNQLEVLFDLFRITSFGNKNSNLQSDKPLFESHIEISPLHPTLSLHTIVIKANLPRFSQAFYTHSPAFLVSLKPTFYTENLQSSIYKLYNLDDPYLQIDDSVTNEFKTISSEKEARMKDWATAEDIVIITDLVENNFPITIQVSLALHAMSKSIECRKLFEIKQNLKNNFFLNNDTISFLIPLSMKTLAWVDAGN